MPAPRPARIGNVTTTPPPHGSIRRLTRRARRLRRHSTRVGPLGSASTSVRGISILSNNDRWHRFVNEYSPRNRGDGGVFARLCPQRLVVCYAAFANETPHASNAANSFA